MIRRASANIRAMACSAVTSRLPCEFASGTPTRLSCQIEAVDPGERYLDQPEIRRSCQQFRRHGLGDQYTDVAPVCYQLSGIRDDLWARTRVARTLCRLVPYLFPPDRWNGPDVDCHSGTSDDSDLWFVSIVSLFRAANQRRHARI